MSRKPERTDGVERKFTKPKYLVHLTLLVAVIVMISPYLWQLATSLKTFEESVQVPPTTIPDDFYFENYSTIFEVIPFASMMGTTIAMTVGRIIGQLVVITLAAYGFARFEFPGKNLIFLVFLSVMMVPDELLIIPQYEIIQSLGWLDTLPALIVPRIFWVFGLFLLRQFFLTLPLEIEEAARIDGAGRFRTFWSVVLPLAKPGMITLAIFSCLFSWKELLWPLIVMSSPDKMPVSVGLATLRGSFFVDYPVLMAGSTLAMLPLILVFIFLQRHFIEGIATTGGKA
ncbi:carbohydrate ABC transporter permease [Arthrobacter castelli]|uniref:carbohydrate ABC transporter permease n=1 Tax=Arthrobacter castelli TaxID=271431 RepID=UPI000683E327|nr:carbohydrate ABC transporter permease [Arthrobacter castelli]